jgi:hypothetical protein
MLCDFFFPTRSVNNPASIFRCSHTYHKLLVPVGLPPPLGWLSKLAAVLSDLPRSSPCLGLVSLSCLGLFPAAVLEVVEGTALRWTSYQRVILYRGGADGSPGASTASSVKASEVAMACTPVFAAREWLLDEGLIYRSAREA